MFRVIRRQPNISIEIKHTPPGYLDEVYPIEVVVTNNETDTVQGLLDVEFRSAGTDGAGMLVAIIRFGTGSHPNSCQMLQAV